MTGRRPRARDNPKSACDQGPVAVFVEQVFTKRWMCQSREARLVIPKFAAQASSLPKQVRCARQPAVNFSIRTKMEATDASGSAPTFASA
ncbi:hypothetical protein CHELA40_12209 [Chelatococcus asaccharovorans]|nr:hypothetical protein CHELA40_12209 [Chelatococcus asaccharovorans]CAH1683235.1 hypothetical protein CHELA17_63398 [Chelatococcus asaccharovorans]